VTQLFCDNQITVGIQCRARLRLCVSAKFYIFRCIFDSLDKKNIHQWILIICVRNHKSEFVKLGSAMRYRFASFIRPAGFGRLISLSEKRILCDLSYFCGECVPSNMGSGR